MYHEIITTVLEIHDEILQEMCIKRFTNILTYFTFRKLCKRADASEELFKGRSFLKQ